MTGEIITPLGNEKPPTTLTCWLTEADRKMMIKRDEKERERKRLAKLPKPKPVGTHGPHGPWAHMTI